MFSYSFWADEAFASGVALQLIQGEISLQNVFTLLPYQKLYVLILALFFRLFGASEFSARLPSVISFVIGICLIFILAKKLSNIYGALLSTFIYLASHLNLSYATQAKPYIILETLTLLVLLLLSNLNRNKYQYSSIIIHILVVLILLIAAFLHSIGIFLWLIYMVHLTRLFTLKNRGAIFLLSFLLIIVLILMFTIIGPYVIYGFFKYNHVYQSVKLFTYKYSLITIPSIVCLFSLIRKKSIMGISIFFYIALIFILSTFQQYIFNIRYVLTVFGILFLYFGIFWAKVGEKYDSNLKFSIFNLRLSGKAIIPLTVIVLLYATGYKIVRWPQVYYNPNIDKYGDVQIANYKDFYSKLKTRFPHYKGLYVVNNIFDVEVWYFGRYSDVYFKKNITKPKKHHVVDAMIYGSLADFKKIMAQHPQGLLIMEDWQSFLPDDVKEYAKKNLKLEFRIESLKEAPNDPWPLALYSWGL